MVITLGFSPCPNDTFIFDALVHHQIDTEGLEFDYFMEDVEKLNEGAFREQPDVTKLSFHAFLSLAGTYLLLDSGAALGFGVGPLVVSKHRINFSQLEGKTIAIPGIHTTANLLLSIALADKPVFRKAILFSEIENAILTGEVDAGVIIHESRFTYQSKGLKKIMDLGEFWEQVTAAPVPLGGIVAHKRLGKEVIAKIDRCIRRSIEKANLNRTQLSDFIRCNAQEMEENVMKQHIDLYVNQYSISLGEHGRAAVTLLFEKALQSGIISKMPGRIFA